MEECNSFLMNMRGGKPLPPFELECCPEKKRSSAEANCLLLQKEADLHLIFIGGGLSFFFCITGWSHMSYSDYTVPCKKWDGEEMSFHWGNGRIVAKVGGVYQLSDF